MNADERRFFLGHLLALLVGAVVVLMLWSVLPVTWLSGLGLALLLVAGVLRVLVC